MIPEKAPICFECAHLIQPAVGEIGYRCLAFPDCIPDPIMQMQVDHHKPYPGDRGIRFELKPGAQMPVMFR
jgi:hypothetical protein